MSENKIVSGNGETPNGHPGDNYHEFLDSIKIRFKTSIAGKVPLFRTDVGKKLFDLFLGYLPEESRQHYNCDSCRHFVNRYGSLVTISNDGVQMSAVWDESKTPEFFVKSVAAINKAIRKSKVINVFLTDQINLGKPENDSWTHMSVQMPREMLFHDPLKRPSQVIADKHQEYQMLQRGLNDFPLPIIEEADFLLKTQSLERSEKCLGVAQWFKELQTRCTLTKSKKLQINMVWLAVATAPTGFCHVRSTMIGTLLEDIKSGLPFQTVKTQFEKKMDGTKYQRPQAPPSNGSIAEAEKIVEKLGNGKSFERRYAMVEELEKIWVPKIPQNTSENSGGMFSHLLPKDNQNKPGFEVPPVKMTWRKFLEIVVPMAEKIECYIAAGRHYNFTGILTAEHIDAPPIIQWDTEEKRNPFSSYLYKDGSTNLDWNLKSGYINVTALSYHPSMWYGGEFSNHAKAVYFILEGAKDVRWEHAGNALFPEILKSELRGIRSVLEAYAKKAKLGNHENASANGISFADGSGEINIKVTTSAGIISYILDRWE